MDWMNWLRRKGNQTGPHWLAKAGYTAGGLLVVCMVVFLYLGFFLTPDNQQTVIYASDEILAGSPMSFRVVLLSSRDGAPLPNASVKIELQSLESKKKTLLYSSRTDKRGSVEPTVKIPDLKEGRYNLIFHTKSGKGADNVVRAVNVTRTYRMLLSTDKPVYQPGQVIHMRMLAVEKGRMKTPHNGSALFEVLDPKGNKVFKKKVPVGDFGVSSADFTLAREINFGPYHIKTTVGDDSAERTVEVKRYALPKFRVIFNPARRTWLPAESVTGTVEGEYFFGKKVQNGRVTIDLSTFDVAFHRVAHLEGKTDEKGMYHFSLDLPSYFVGQPLDKGRGILKCDVAVIDGAGHEEKVTDTLTIARSLKDEQNVSRNEPAAGKIPVIIDCIPERKEIIRGVENRLFVVTSLPGGTPLSCDVTLALPGKMKKGHSDESGVAEFLFTPASESVKISLSAHNGDKYAGQATLTLNAGMRRGEVLLRANCALYKVGDEMKLTVLSPEKRGTIYVDVVRDKQTLLTRSLELQSGKGEMVIDLTDDMVGTLCICAYRIMRDGNTVRDVRTVAVSQAQDLVVTASADRDTYRPGEKATFSFQVRDKSGKPVMAALGLAIVDESVFALAEKHPGLEKVYLALEKELMEPKIEVCEHNCSLDMKSIVAQGSYTPKAQRAASVILAALGDSPGGQFVSTMVDKMAQTEKAMKNFRNAGFSILGGLILACLLWLALKVSESERSVRREHESPLLTTFHLACLAIFTLLASIGVYEESFHNCGFVGLFFIYLYLFICLLPFLSVAAYLYDSNGWRGAIQFVVIMALANIAIYNLLLNAHFINQWEVISSSIFFLALATGLISLFTGAILGLRARFGNGGLFGGFFLILPLYGMILSIQHRDEGYALLSLLAFILTALIILGITSRYIRILSSAMELFIVLAILVLLAAIILPNFCRARCQGQLTACKSNLKNIGTSLEMFSTDHGGHYPRELSEITPNYLKVIPTCPTAGKDTYSASYKSRRNPDYYFVCCGGSYHVKEGVPGNVPAYDSLQGLIESAGGAAQDMTPQGEADDAPKAPATIAGIRVRQFFPETLYWNPLLITDEKGKATVEVPMADSITTWRLTGTAHTERGVIGSFTKPIRVFQDFFIDPDLPEHLTRGDSISLPVALYNYLPRAQKLEVSLVPDNWFEVQGDTKKYVTMRPNEVTSVTFPIKVTRVGEYRFTVLARSDSQKDAVSRTIRVDPDGREVVVVKNGTLAGNLSYVVPIPPESVPGSGTILVKIYPGVSTQLIDGLDGMLAMPFG